MPEGGFFKRLIRRLRGGAPAGSQAEPAQGPSAPAPQAPGTVAPGCSAPSSGPAAAPPAALPPAVPEDEQAAQLRQTLARLADLPKALQELSRAVQAQSALNSHLQEALAGLAEPNPDLLHALSDLAGEGRKQCELLESLRAELSERTESDLRAQQAVAQLPDLLDRINRSNASHIELMEQMRDRWASAGQSIADQLVRHGRQFATLATVALALLGLIALLGVIALFRG